MSLFDVYSVYELTIVRGRDVYVYDDEGNRYLDLYGGHAVISIGHSHPGYVKALSDQLSKLAFYSNAVKNPLQDELSDHLNDISAMQDYQLFLCNSGAEANENALKLASFHTGKKKIVAFENGFHGRTSAAVSVTDNDKIISPLNAQHDVELLPFDDIERFEQVLSNGDVAAVIFEAIQGIGGLDEPSIDFVQSMSRICRENGTVLIADEVQCGFGRTGDFFAFSCFGIQPDIVSMAKGMGNGFPVGGILIHPGLKPKKGMLGSTFGGNHLACTSALSVLKEIENMDLMNQARLCHNYFKDQLDLLGTDVKLKGRGLMLGLEFDFPVDQLRQTLMFKHHVLTGSSKNKNLLRLLPPLTIQPHHFDIFFNALNQELPWKSIQRSAI